MRSSLFADRATRFAESLEDGETKAQMLHFLRQSDFWGPIVTFVGAEGRGKTTLFGKISHLTPSSAASIRFAAVGEWKRPIKDMEVPDSIFQELGQGTAGDALFCDAPPIGTSNRDKVVSSLLAVSDLIVMAVQITQPAGADEVAFAKKHLVDAACVLVLTKCDQADGEDLQDGVNAVEENYSDIPWLAILRFDLSKEPDQAASDDVVLPRFEQWWQTEGQQRAEEARKAHLKRLQQGWIEQARHVLDHKEQEYAPQLEAISQSLAASSSIAQAQRLQTELMEGLKTLPERALALYKNRLPELRLQVSHTTHQITDGVKSGKAIIPSEIENEISKVYQEWDADSRAYVRAEMTPFQQRLEEVAAHYESLIRSVSQADTPAEMTNVEQEQAKFGLYADSQTSILLQGDFDLTISDKLRTVATPTVSALGTGVLLLSVVGATVFAPLAPLIALVGAGVAGVGAFGSISEGTQRRRAGELEKAIQRQAFEQEHLLQQQIYSDWKQFSERLRDIVATSKRRLTNLVLQHASLHDGALSEKYKGLTSNIAKVENLRRDLLWLEEYAQGAKIGSEGKE